MHAIYVGPISVLIIAKMAKWRLLDSLLFQRSYWLLLYYSVALKFKYWYGFNVFRCIICFTVTGYGHMVPTTAYSRVFFIFYALIGIPLFLIHIAAVGSYLNKLLKHCGNKLNSIISSDNKGRLEWVIALCFHVVAFAVLVLLPAFVLSAMEGWRYSESIYFIVVSLATVGFGDYVAGMNPRVWIIRLMIQQKSQLAAFPTRVFICRITNGWVYQPCDFQQKVFPAELSAELLN